MTYHVGIDPDTHDTAIAWCDASGNPVSASVIHVPKCKGVVRQAAVLEMMKVLEGDLQAILSDIGGAALRSVAVEAQTLQRSGIKQHSNPYDIVILGNVAGCILGSLAGLVLFDQILFPTPEEWKGQIPKAVMQARLYKELGWGYKMIGPKAKPTYAQPLKVPEDFEHIKPADFKHIGDAILLARWASKQKRK